MTITATTLVLLYVACGAISTYSILSFIENQLKQNALEFYGIKDNLGLATLVLYILMMIGWPIILATTFLLKEDKSTVDERRKMINDRLAYLETVEDSTQRKLEYERRVAKAKAELAERLKNGKPS